MDDTPPPTPEATSAPSDGVEQTPAAQPAVSYITAPPSRDRWAHRRTEPRPFALLWIIYLIAAALISFGIAGTFAYPSAELYKHATRVMLFLACMGVAIFWPMLRLSQARPEKPRLSVVLDLLVLLPPLQCVVWPQAFDWMSRWTFGVVLGVSLASIGWSLIVGAVLALALSAEPTSLATRERTSRRSLWMIVFLAATVLGPACSLSLPTIGDCDPWLMASPVGSTLEILRQRSWSPAGHAMTVGHWWGVASTWGVAIVAWILVAVVGRPVAGSCAGGIARGREHA